MKNKIYLVGIFILVSILIGGCITQQPSSCPDANTYVLFVKTNISILNAEEAYNVMMEYKGVRNPDKNDTKDNFPKIIDQRGVPPEQYPDYEE